MEELVAIVRRLQRENPYSCSRRKDFMHITGCTDCELTRMLAGLDDEYNRGNSGKD